MSSDLERTVDTELRARLEPLGWTIDDQPRLGNTSRPDLVVQDPNGRHYVIEFRLDRAHPLHFGRIAQVEGYKKLAETTWGEPVRAVLVYSGNARPALLDDARVLDVDLVPAGVDSPRAVAIRLERYLRGLGGPPLAGDVAAGADGEESAESR